jgi:hypothetical protein
MKQWLVRFSTQGKNLLFLLGAYIFMAAVVMNGGSNKINSLSGKELQPLDLHFSYTPEQVYTWLGDYGEEGRQFYALFEMTGDVIYPIIYTLLFCCLIGYTWKKFIEEKEKFATLVLVPLPTLLFDYLENVCIVVLLKTYPAPQDTWVMIGSLFTSLKWISLIITLIVFLIGVIKRFFK